MQVKSADSALPVVGQASVSANVRVLAGNLNAVPIGTLLQATVTRVSLGEAVLSVNGQMLTVRPAVGLQLGAVLLVRLPNGNLSATPTLDLVNGTPPPSAGPPGQAATSPGLSGRLLSPSLASPPTPPSTQPASQNATPPRTLTISQVNVLSVLPDGRMRVNIEGQEDVATTDVQLTVGGRYVLQVERTSAGLILRSPPDDPDLSTAVVAAVLRDSVPPDLGASLKPLLAELAALEPDASESVGGNSVNVKEAANVVRDALGAFLPSASRPPNSTELQNLVENGGLLFEAKLARLVTANENPSDGESSNPNQNGSGTAQPNRQSSPDLKESLLRLLQAVRDFGNVAQMPATRAALDGIEAQQAANVFAQDQGKPYVLQVPFPDGGEWRTLHLAVEPERNRRQGSGESGDFRLLMHVPLTDLGETWIDAGLSSNRFRALLYLDGADARDRVRAELPGLRTELLDGGFSEVLLDVRPTSDLPARQRKQVAAMQAGRPGSGTVLDVRA